MGVVYSTVEIGRIYGFGDRAKPNKDPQEGKCDETP